MQWNIMKHKSSQGSRMKIGSNWSNSLPSTPRSSRTFSESDSKIDMFKQVWQSNKRQTPTRKIDHTFSRITFFLGGKHIEPLFCEVKGGSLPNSPGSPNEKEQNDVVHQGPLPDSILGCNWKPKICWDKTRQDWFNQLIFRKDSVVQKKTWILLFDLQGWKRLWKILELEKIISSFFRWRQTKAPRTEAPGHVSWDPQGLPKHTSLPNHFGMFWQNLSNYWTKATRMT